MSQPHPPRALTQDECRATVLAHVHALVAYWDGVEGETQRDRLDGLAFSVLVMLDGGAGGAGPPAFTVTPAPHPDDALARIARGEDYWPDDVELGPALHEEWAART